MTTNFEPRKIAREHWVHGGGVDPDYDDGRLFNELDFRVDGPIDDERCFELEYIAMRLPPSLSGDKVDAIRALMEMITPAIRELILDAPPIEEWICHESYKDFLNNIGGLEEEVVPAKPYRWVGRGQEGVLGPNELHAAVESSRLGSKA